MTEVKSVVNIENFKIMDYRKLLGDILNAIPQSITPTNKKGANAEICYKIQQTAISIGHPSKLSGTSVFIVTPETIGLVLMTLI